MMKSHRVYENVLGAKAAALFLLAPTAAFAGISQGDVLGTDEAAVAAALEQQGYKVMEIETEDGLIEVEFLADGAAMEIEVDVTTGQVLEVDDD